MALARARTLAIEVMARAEAGDALIRCGPEESVPRKIHEASFYLGGLNQLSFLP